MSEAGSDVSSGKRKVLFVFESNDAQSKTLAESMGSVWGASGYETLAPTHGGSDLDWASSFGAELSQANVVVGFVSSYSVSSEVFAQQIESARELSRERRGRPSVWIVRVDFIGAVPEPMQAIENENGEFSFETGANPEQVASALLKAVDAKFAVKAVESVKPRKGLRLLPVTSRKPPEVKIVTAKPDTLPPPLPAELEPVGGAAPLSSEFYIEREADSEMRNAIARDDSIVLIKGPRQIGKTSLMARGVQYARERGARVALTDFQKFNSSNLDDVVSFFISLGESLADQLDLDVFPSDVWDDRRGASVNFERYLRREVLARATTQLVWGMDEIDRLFSCPYGSEVFGLFRSWHNERALDPSGPWAGLTLLIGYATEAHLFISDMNQSPFNVGVRLELNDFSREDLVELNRRHREPLTSDADIDRMYALVGGHPFLVRKGLYEMASRKIGIGEFEKAAPSPDGVFGDHLRRILVLLGRDPGMLEALKSVLRNGECPDAESFYRLRSAGVIVGGSKSEARARCQLYDTFLSERLL